MALSAKVIERLVAAHLKHGALNGQLAYWQTGYWPDEENQ
jgi:hypothetical protein